MTPVDDSQEDKQATQQAGSETAPDSETQSSAASNQGRDNNPDIRQEQTGGSSFEQAEGDPDVA